MSRGFGDFVGERFKLEFSGRSPTRPRRGHIESRRDISSAARHISSPEGTYRLRVFVDIHPSGVRYASGMGLRLDIPLSRLDMRLWRKNSPINPNLKHTTRTLFSQKTKNLLHISPLRAIIR